jgi:hypothetical protein
MWKESDGDLDAVLKELAAREPIFHRPEFGTTRAEFESMMAPEFREVGASGQEYNREFVLDVLEKRHAGSHNDAWKTSNFRCQRLAAELYLLTYLLLQDSGRLTRRATIWRRTDAGWKIVYHQGTVVANQG